LVIRNFDETLKEKRKTQITFTRGFQNIFKSFSTPNLKVIFTVVLLVSLGFSFFTQFFSVFMFKKFDYGTKETGILFGWVGIWLVFTQGFIVRKMVRTLSPHKIMNVSLLALSIAIGILLLPDKAWMFYFINPLIAISQGITSPNLTAIVSGRAGAERQGEMLGVNQSMISVGQIIPPLLGGYFSVIDVGLPIMAAASLIFLAWLVFVFIFK
jgi:DHA1 family tetracycline resistance protein-like MFS transporter